MRGTPRRPGRAGRASPRPRLRRPQGRGHGCENVSRRDAGGEVAFVGSACSEGVGEQPLGVLVVQVRARRASSLISRRRGLSRRAIRAAARVSRRRSRTRPRRSRVLRGSRAPGTRHAARQRVHRCRIRPSRLAGPPVAGVRRLKSRPKDAFPLLAGDQGAFAAAVGRAGVVGCRERCLAVCGSLTMLSPVPPTAWRMLRTGMRRLRILRGRVQSHTVTSLPLPPVQ